MSSGADKRQQATAKRAYLLRQQGLTNRQIAELIGKPVDRVPKLVKVGERLSN